MQEIGKKQRSHTDFFLALLVVVVIIAGVAWWWFGVWPFKGNYTLEQQQTATTNPGAPHPPKEKVPGKPGSAEGSAAPGSTAPDAGK